MSFILYELVYYIISLLACCSRKIYYVVYVNVFFSNLFLTVSQFALFPFLPYFCSSFTVWVLPLFQVNPVFRMLFSFFSSVSVAVTLHSLRSYSIFPSPIPRNWVHMWTIKWPHYSKETKDIIMQLDGAGVVKKHLLRIITNIG